MKIFLEPQETLHFRNGRPFNAGEVGYAETIFPPTPETLQGIVRALIASHWDRTRSIAEVFQEGSDLVKLIGNSRSYGRFRITDIALARRTGTNIEALYPVPAHILIEEKTKRLFLLKPDRLADTISNMPHQMQYLVIQGKPKNKLDNASGWLTKNDLSIALNARTDDDLEDIGIIKESDIFEREFRVGIGIDASRKAVEEGLLYSMQMIRMKKEYHPYEKNYGFLIEMHIAQEDAPDQEEKNDTQRIYDVLQADGWSTMGGERRAVRFKAFDTDTSHLSTKGNLLYLVTPAVFSGGWKPDNVPADPVAAAVPRYQSIGGWQLDPRKSGGGHNKEMRRCVPAGSVYFFDNEIAIPPDIGSGNTTQIGYGITRTGVWK
jgi:CRISPR-associated protein Cmr3